jgi:CheY-like chemotaxis protein
MTTDKKKILLIDDDRDFLKATRLILESGGYEVFVAEDGKEGLAMVDKLSPDLTITDMMMESWGEGFNVVSTIRAKKSGASMPIIVLSGVDLQGPYQSYEPSDEFPKVDLVLHKPVKAEDLLKYTKKLLR